MKRRFVCGNIFDNLHLCDAQPMEMITRIRAW